MTTPLAHPETDLEALALLDAQLDSRIPCTCPNHDGECSGCVPDEPGRWRVLLMHDLDEPTCDQHLVIWCDGHLDAARRAIDKIRQRNRRNPTKSVGCVRCLQWWDIDELLIVIGEVL